MSTLSSSAPASFLPSVELSPEQIFEGNHRLICVEEDGMSSSFVLHFLLADFLNWSSPIKAGYPKSSAETPSDSYPKVVLVLTANTLNHWTTVSSRIGAQLSRLMQTGSIIVLDPMKELFLTLVDPSTNTSSSDNISQLGHLYNSLVSLNPSLVIIEDLQFFTASSNQAEVLRFVAKLKRLPMSTIVGHVPNPLGSILGTTRFIVSALETGGSSSVSALLHVISSKQLRSYHYKLDERSIKLSFKPQS